MSTRRHEREVDPEHREAAESSTPTASAEPPGPDLTTFER